MEMRGYEAADQAACLELFDSNMPEYFSGGEREAFAEWLAAPRGSYWVAEHEGELAGCGGIVLEHASLASVTWLMVAGRLRGQGLGRYMLFYLLKGLPAAVTHVRLSTVAPVSGFFEKQGFRVQGEGPEGVEMVKKLQVCS
ncbi:MAG: GNAT family N-acetyltransferase [Bryobacterales bacterium]|nr:GNAT family N-acetyltransferase [Bryobacterales bacterium]